MFDVRRSMFDVRLVTRLDTRPLTPILSPAYRGEGAIARRAFTLVELLVVIGIIAVLMSILMPALGSARRAGLQTRSLNNIRQLGLGYAQYHIENRGALPFGYPPAVVNGVPTQASLPSGHTTAFPTASRYPWRLVPYVSDVWQVIHAHKETPPIPNAGDSPQQAEMKAYTLSLSPTYGLNAYYLGGHTGFFGFGPNGGPNTAGPAVFKAGQVKRPSELIVFTDVTASGIPGVGQDDGYFVVTPPRTRSLHWAVDRGKCVPTASGVAMGLPQGRYEKGPVVAFFDGHAESMNASDLTDMRLWSAQATSRDWQYTP